MHEAHDKQSTLGIRPPRVRIVGDTRGSSPSEVCRRGHTVGSFDTKSSISLLCIRRSHNSWPPSDHALRNIGSPVWNTKKPPVRIDQGHAGVECDVQVRVVLVSGPTQCADETIHAARQRVFGDQCAGVRL